jgi:cyanophycin synthetase
MKILESQLYSGASYWADVPVVLFRVEPSTLECTSSSLLPGLSDKLATTLPKIHEHYCYSGSTFVNRLREGTSLDHIAQHMALELQKMAGQKIGCAQTCLPPGPRGETPSGTDYVIVRYEQRDIGVAAGQLALRLLESWLEPAAVKNFDFPSEIKEFLRLAACLSYGPSTRALVAEAKRRNIPVQRLDDSRERAQLGRGTRALRSLLQLGYGKYQRHIWAPYISVESHLATEIALNKDLTYRLVQNAGLPVPRSIKVKDEESAVAAAREVGYPVVLKPLDGNHGRGVGVNLQNEAAVRAHYPTAFGETHTGTVLVEKFIPGNTYRVLVVGGQAVAVTEEVPAHVVGDGSHTLRQLISLTNADPRRGHGSENLLVRIRLDETAIAMAKEQGYGPDDIPPVGRHVQLVRTAHISLGGISIDRTDDIHPYNAMIAEQAAQVIGLQVAGIDLIAQDISRSVRETGGAICEVNAGPGLGLHIEPVEGKPRDVARPVVDLLFPPGAISRVPIVAVIGTEAQSMTSRVVAHILQVAGHRVGLANSEGMYLGENCIVEGDMSGPDSARVVLRNPAIESAVLEIGYEGILRSGLGYDQADVAVVTRIGHYDPALIGIRTPRDLVHLSAVVANSARPGGQIVLNADDEECVEIGSRASQEVVYFSMHSNNPVVERHVGAGGRAIVFRGRSESYGLFLLDAGKTTFLLANETPSTCDERDLPRAVSLLAAASACAALDIENECICRGLRGIQKVERERNGQRATDKGQRSSERVA